MNKILRFIFIFFILIFYSSCSFDTKTGIWTDKKRKTANTELIKLSSYKEKFQEELNPDLKINFVSKVKKNNKWIMS